MRVLALLQDIETQARAGDVTELVPRFRAVLAFLADPDPDVRARAARVARELARLDPRCGPELVRALMRALELESVAETRGAFVAALSDRDRVDASAHAVHTARDPEGETKSEPEGPRTRER